MKPASILTVLYDGGCPMCLREINHYRTLKPLVPIRWTDISIVGANELPLDVTREAAMRVFHVIDENGLLHRGAAGFVALWRVLPGYRWLGRLVRGLGLVPLLEWAYGHFANWRYRRRCQAGYCPAGDG